MAEPVPQPPSTAAALKEAGNAAFAKGDYPTAVALYSEAVELSAARELQTVLLCNLSAAHLKAADPAAARIAATRATALDNMNAKAHNRLGAALQELGAFSAARAAFSRVLRSAATESSRSCATSSLDRMDAASERLFDRSNQLLNAGCRLNALRELLRCLRVSPGHTSALRNFSMVGNGSILESLSPEQLSLGFNSTGEQTALPDPDPGISVTAFLHDGLWQGGVPVLLPSTMSPDQTLEILAAALGIELDNSLSATVFNRAGAQLGQDIPWSAVVPGEWLAVQAPGQLNGRGAPISPACWPARRCADSVVLGAVQRVERQAAVSQIASTQRQPVVVTGSRLIEPAVSRPSIHPSIHLSVHPSIHLSS